MIFMPRSDMLFCMNIDLDASHFMAFTIFHY